MSGLAEDSVNQSQARIWAGRAALALGAVLIVTLIVWAGRSLMGGVKAPRHQTVKIALLPDVPPPPPPKEEKKPEPKEEKPLPQVDLPKQQTPPEPQQLKMEGPAGDAPSPFAGGEVKNDYIGGDVGDAMGKYAFYTNRLTQQIQEELAHRNLHGTSGRVLLWLDIDGSVRRFKLMRFSGAAETERLQTAFAEIKRVREAPPSDMPMPVGLDVSVQ